MRLSTIDQADEEGYSLDEQDAPKYGKMF